MYNLSAELGRFYWNEVVLGKDRRKTLAGYRNTNLNRLSQGLAALGEKNGVEYALWKERRNQGSYAMHTLNRHKDNDYDIDVCLVWDEDDLPKDAAEARKLICAAFREKPGNFSKLPEARKNAVTVYYTEGYHIDFAVFRRRDNGWGSWIYEHAGADGWTERDPEAVTTWFSERVDTLSPYGPFSFVKQQQLRRVVRLMKWYAKSRSGWMLPGGVIMSALLAEVYKPSYSRDDVALYDTMVALRDRLRNYTEVYSPVDGNPELTAPEKCAKQVKRLLEKLEVTVEDLAVLRDPDCTEAQARAAWNCVFRHKFWKPVEEKASKNALALPYSLGLECGMAQSEGGRIWGDYPSGGKVLPRGIHLRFRVASTSVPPPFMVKWIVQNEGDEAQDASQLNWHRQGEEGMIWTSTEYRGDHTMTCQIIRDGRTLAEATHLVRIRGETRSRLFGRR